MNLPDLAHIAIIRERDRGLGVDGHLLFRAPMDMKRFKELTYHQVVIMGRQTFKSLGYRPLPNRINLVVTSSPLPSPISPPPSSGCGRVTSAITCTTLDEAIRRGMACPSVRTVFIIGGQRLYEDTLPLVDRVYLTVARAVVKSSDDQLHSDRFYPILRNPYFRLESTTDWFQDGEVELKFQTWNRDRRFICPVLR
jgi:dihydrofolate reductase